MLVVKCSNLKRQTQLIIETLKQMCSLPANSAGVFRGVLDKSCRVQVGTFCMQIVRYDNKMALFSLAEEAIFPVVRTTTFG